MIKGKYKLIIALSSAAIFILAITLYWQRNNILEPFIREKADRYEQKKSIKISYDKIYLSGLNDLRINNLCIAPQDNDTLVYIREVEAKLNLWKLPVKEVELQDLRINGFTLSFKDYGGKRNFDFLLQKGEDEPAFGSDQSTSGYTQKISRFLTLFFRFIPEDILVSDINISAQSADFFSSLTIPELKIEDHCFFSQVLAKENGKEQNFFLEGFFRRSDKKLSCKVSALEKKLVEIPYLQHKYHTRVLFDTLQFRFSQAGEEKDLLQLEGFISFYNLSVQNERLSTEEILFQNSKMNYLVNVHPDYLELDSATTVQFNKLDFHPYISLKVKPEVNLTVSVRKKKIPADNLFSSLPKGLFRNLEGIQTAGNLSYNFYFAVDMSEVDSLKFQSSLSKEDFSIKRFGKTDFTKIREPFLYSAYEKGELVKTFEVGELCPDFRNLEAISPYLRSAVLFAEDGFFYGHNGFVEEALQASLVKDIKEKRFARGGSTISMQLVKNLYLSRDKTITRKLEEALIVWLIENNRLVSKNRMFEIYLNIIEWGPGIYGANEAARFYFNKEAADLIPEEAIFMASIVSHPKKFMWSFDKSRNLKPYLSNFYEVVGKRMLNHDYMTEEQFEKLVPNVKIKGKASAYLEKIDTTEVEELETEW